MNDPISPPEPTMRERVVLASLVAGVIIMFLAVWLGVLASTAKASPQDPNFGHKVSLCHATGSASNPFVAITVDVAASGLNGGHTNHSGDIIPAFTYVDNQGATHSYAGKNLGTMYNGATGSSVLANGCAVPTNPPVTDACPNLDGIQETVPDGYHLDDAGDCVLDTPPGPTDVCPNLDGDQAEVPDGYYIDDSGDCVEETPGTTDMCPNIDGDQAEVPTGYHLEGDLCVADTPTAGETGGPDTNVAGQSSSPATTAGTTSAGTSNGELPYTGLPEEAILLLGIVLTIVGLMLVRHGQRRSLS